MSVQQPKKSRHQLKTRTTGNGVGFEIFEFIDPPTKAASDITKDWSLENQYQRGGYFHLGVTSPDPDAVAKEACKDGAVQIGETITMYDGERALYLRDPWGCVVEVLSCSFEQLMVRTTPLVNKDSSTDGHSRVIESSNVQ